MARTIQSPGVQITEQDFTIRNVGAQPTVVFIPGFAAKGPSSEPISVTSVSEFEQIYGQPSNAAERYFYHTTKAILQSPASVIVYRLPYGNGAGFDVSTEYSALVYPVVSYVDGVSSTAIDRNDSVYFFGKPTHLKLSQPEYLSILRGDGFTWSNNTSGATAFSNVASLKDAGLILLNKAQTTINTRYEGTYVGIIDNTNLNPATPYNDINSVLSINSDAQAIGGGDYVNVPSTRLNFGLSAAAGTGGGNNLTISEILENIPSYDISSSKFDDTVSVGVFKLVQSSSSPDVIALDYILKDGFTASFDYNRQIASQNGGPAISNFLEQVDNNSTNIISIVNPFISNKNKPTWLDSTGLPTKKVRFLSQGMSEYLNGESSQDYINRIGAPIGQVRGFLNLLGETNNLVALGDYDNQDLTTKLIGNVPTKLDYAFDKINNVDLYPVNLTTEAGLGTVYLNSFNPATSGYFDDTVPYDSAVQSLTAQTGPAPFATSRYMEVATSFLNFTNVRKDHLFIADPITNIFVQGSNIKTLDLATNSFNNNIYWPLKNQFAGINTSYACTFANCARVSDVTTNQDVWVPFSGFAAAAMANTDSNFQPWFAPAGFKRGVLTGVVDIALYPKQKQRDLLYRISLNPVTFFPAEGYVIFGQKTLQKIPSAFDRINVRRLFLSLETATRDTVKYFVFEPNTLFTRTQILNSISPIFDNAKNTQGVYDYLIICDERNNTTNVIDDNTIVIDIYIKPVRSAEYILCNFYATRTGTSFQEIVS